MRKQLLLLLALCCPSLWVLAERIDVATAHRVAVNVAQQGDSAVGLRSSDEVTLVYAAAPGEKGVTLRSAASDVEADYFVFNFPSDKGFAIISGEDRVRPILGYSYTGSFDPDNLPTALKGMLTSYQRQIEWAINQNLEASSSVTEEWSNYLSGAMPKTRALTITTAEWSQDDPYNRKAPMIGKERAYVGCVATAMGIVMKHHEYPAKAVNPPKQNTYSVDGNKVTAKFKYEEYDWENMLYVYKDSAFTDVEANAVATLLFHCGINTEMNFELEGSGTNNLYAAKALRDVFGYSPEIRYLNRDAYRWTEWKKMLRDELDEGYPVLYDGYGETEGGHAFVCDGYDDKDHFHINWGWSGYRNGFFSLSLLSGFDEDQNMVLHIRPEATGETYYVRPYLTSAVYTKKGKWVSVDFSMKYCAIDDHKFWFGLGVADEDNAIVKAPKEEDVFSHDLEAYLSGWNEYNADSVTTTLDADLSKGERVTMLCSVDGENWEVMRTLEVVPSGIGDDNASPETANEAIGTETLRVWSQQRQLFIQTDKEETARIITMDGRPYKTLHLSAGIFVEEMPRGIYVVLVGGQAFKLMF